MTVAGGTRWSFLYYGDTLVGFKLGNDTYYYLRNLQGDIVQIVDANGAVVVSYRYDDWGKPVSITGSAAATVGVQNPFRYRGYFYDNETGLYYVSSRYYDPEVGRWISPEPNVYAGAFDGGSGVLAYNVYVYCANNPGTFSDLSGEGLALALAGGGYVTAATAVGGTNIWNPVGWAILGVTAVIVVGATIYHGVKAYSSSQKKAQEKNNENLQKKVKDILKTKKGSIKNAKPPKGSPGWESIMELTLEEIYRRAQNGDPGFNYFKKLLTDGRFNK